LPLECYYVGIAPALRPENPPRPHQAHPSGSQETASSSSLHRRRMHSAMVLSTSLVTMPCCRVCYTELRAASKSGIATLSIPTATPVCRDIRPRVADKAESVHARSVRTLLVSVDTSPSPHVVCWHAAKQRLASPSSFRPRVWCPKLPDPSLPAHALRSTSLRRLPGEVTVSLGVTLAGTMGAIDVPRGQPALAK
jgi:hypothetical protein